MLFQYLTVASWIVVLIVFFIRALWVINAGRALAGDFLKGTRWKAFFTELFAFVVDNTLALTLGLVVRILVPGVASGLLSGIAAGATSLFVFLQKR
jgi:predicted anti-sigma-YlaC factor YlaD